MSGKKTKKILLSTLLLIFSAVLLVTAAENKIPGLPGEDIFEHIELFADSVTLISMEYVEAVKVKELVYGAIKGMTGILDGYSQFLEPDSFKEISEDTKGEFGGIGIEIGIREGVLTVIAPMEGTPASESGILAGDRIVKINDEITRDMTLDDAVKHLRGEPGTSVKIGVVREDTDKVREFEIKRAVIKLESIKEGRILEDDIGYIRIIEFQMRTPEDLKKSVEELKERGMRNLIIDLRNNPGGLLESAATIADYFLEPGELIVYTEGRDPEDRIEFISKKKTDLDDIRIIILVNKGTASASEILAGAIRDNSRGILVGVQTFGKGSVQTVVPLKDGSAIKMTTAAYYTPSGRNLRDKGLEPDVYVEYVKPADSEGDDHPPEDKKDDIFSDLKSDLQENSADDPAKEDRHRAREIYDSQLKTAVSIFKGLSILKERAVSGDYTSIKHKDR